MKMGNISWIDLLKFELTIGFPIAIKVLNKHLGPLKTIRLLALFSWQDMALNPVKKIKPPFPTHAESMSIHQFKPVFLLYRGLKYLVGQERALEILSDVVSSSGSKFLASYVPTVDPDEWAQLSEEDKASFSGSLREMFFNSKSTGVQDPAYDFAFDVHFCYFVSFAQQLDCPEIMTLFCEADSRYFEENDTGIEFERQHTLATGSACCDFRFCFKER